MPRAVVEMSTPPPNDGLTGGCRKISPEVLPASRSMLPPWQSILLPAFFDWRYLVLLLLILSRLISPEGCWHLAGGDQGARIDKT
jgi:hypothetical protein